VDEVELAPGDTALAPRAMRARDGNIRVVAEFLEIVA